MAECLSLVNEPCHNVDDCVESASCQHGQEGIPDYISILKIHKEKQNGCIKQKDDVVNRLCPQVDIGRDEKHRQVGKDQEKTAEIHDVMQVRPNIRGRVKKQGQNGERIAGKRLCSVAVRIPLPKKVNDAYAKAER